MRMVVEAYPAGQVVLKPIQRLEAVTGETTSGGDQQRLRLGKGGLEGHTLGAGGLDDRDPGWCETLGRELDAAGQHRYLGATLPARFEIPETTLP